MILKIIVKVCKYFFVCPFFVSFSYVNELRMRKRYKFQVNSYEHEKIRGVIDDLHENFRPFLICDNSFIFQPIYLKTHMSIGQPFFFNSPSHSYLKFCL